MKLGMTLGLIAGIVLLLVGVIVAFIGGAVGGIGYGVGATGTATRGGLLVVLAIGLPIMAIVGAALSFSNQKLAAILMAIPGALTALLGATGEPVSGFIIGLGIVLLASAYFTYSATPKPDAAADA